MFIIEKKVTLAYTMINFNIIKTEIGFLLQYFLVDIGLKINPK